MVSFNWVDIIILLILADALYNGIHIGFLTLLLTFTGFFGSLFIIGLILPHLLPIPDSTIKAVVNGNLLFIISIYCGFKGYEYGSHLHKSFSKGAAHIVESASGLILSSGAAVITIWLIAAAIGSLPFVGLSNSVDNSYFVQLFSRHLPAAPAVFERFSVLVDPNQSPAIYVKDLPNSSIGSAPLPPVTAAVKKAGLSVVRITGFGCSGIVDGSGFVISPGLVATNAHVIAGVKRPIIKYGPNSYVGTPVLFDPNLDFALLRVNGIKATPLAINTGDLNKGTVVDTIGYPNSIFTVSGGTVRGSLQISGGNIYGLGTIIRSIYVIQAPIAQGLSGGPVVLPNGSFGGIIFARSSNTKGYGYALTANSLLGDINRGKSSQQPVSSGACIS